MSKADTPSAEQFIARAAALQAHAAIERRQHLFAPELPAMDVDTFLRELNRTSIELDNVSLALVGYGLNDGDLQERVSVLGVPIVHISSDLHAAAAWRNEPAKHSIIIALAVGHHPGVSTLAHFPTANARDLVRSLLTWAASDTAQFAETEPQRQLLEALSQSGELTPLVSLNGVAAFLAAWRAYRSEDELDAPRRALPQLGVLRDKHLFAQGRTITERLKANSALTRQLVSMPVTKLTKLRQRLERQAREADGEATEIQGALDVLDRIGALRSTGSIDALNALDFDEVQRLLRPAKPETDPPSNSEDLEDVDEDVRGPEGVSEDAGEALLDDDGDRLEVMVRAVEQALDDGGSETVDAASGTYGDDEQAFKFELDRDFLTWTHAFCSEQHWGGYYRADRASFEDAVRDYSQHEPTPFAPLAESIAHDDEKTSLRDLLQPLQRELVKQERALSGDLVKLWDHIVEGRNRVLGSLPILIHQPLLAMAGKPSVAKAASELIAAWDELYRLLSRYHQAMSEIDAPWTRAVLEAIAALDIVQIETQLDSETTAWKAVLLPTHPLHLWRYERMAALSRGLDVAGLDRKAVLAQLSQPEHYLGVIYLSSFPEGRGGNRELPVARDYRGLAVFENFRNAYSGSDGVRALVRCLRQFTLIYSNHTRPVRLALINPPQASDILVQLVAILRDVRARDVRFRIEVYATPPHRMRLRDTRRFRTNDRDLIEEHIRSGRLRLRVHDEPRPLEELLGQLQRSPVHVAAIFDEASTEMRYAKTGSDLLPMSPFTVRRRIGFQGIRKRIELQPSSEETVFRSFYDLMGRLRGFGENKTPRASADAERIRRYIDETLQGARPGAFWFFFADRALPSSSTLRSARLMEKQEGHRRAICFDTDYMRLALLLRAPLDEFNLRFQPDELGRLLSEAVGLVGDGLIDLLQIDGQPDTNRVRGLAGTLVAARHYRTRHPEALLVSVDSDLARLWLRLADRGERSDLIALREEDDTLVVEVIEVKTVGTSGAEVANADIEKAKTQLSATLEAVRSGLANGSGGLDAALAAPRQEMLKELFVAGCQSIDANASDRERWANWLRELFGEIDGTNDSQLRGVIYAIELSNSGREEIAFLSGTDGSIELRRLREETIQSLVSQATDVPAPPSQIMPDENGESSSGASAELSSLGPLTPDPRPRTGERPDDVGQMDATEPDDHWDRGSAPGNDAPLATGSAGNDGTPDQTETNTRVPKGSSDPGIRFLVGERIGSGPAKTYTFHPSNTELNQLNVGIVGDLGTGKTQLTKALIAQLTRAHRFNRGHRPKFLIFDYKRDYTKPDFVKAVGARVVRPHRIPLNLFDLGEDCADDPLARLGRVKFLNDVLSKIYGGIGPKQRNQLKQAVLKAYSTRAHAMPSLADVMSEYEALIGDKIDAPYSILSDLADLEMFVPDAAEAISFDEFFDGVVVVDLAALGIGEKERNMLVVLFLNFFYEYMQRLEKRPYVGSDPQLRFVDAMLLVDEADNIMKYNFEVLRQILLQGREFGVGVVLASQYLSHFRTRDGDYSEPLLTWFVHKVPNLTARELGMIGLNSPTQTTVERVKTLAVHECLYKTHDVPGRFMRGIPFYELEKK